METEYETKILNINIKLVQKILEEERVTLKLGRRLQRRYVYDIVPGDMSQWLRLRTDGVDTTLTRKKILHDGVDGTLEDEVFVSDFEEMNRILEGMGYKAKAYQENYRTTYLSDDGTAFEIDEWPMIPPYLEIEAIDKETVEKWVGYLGYQMYETTSENTNKVYARYGIDLPSITELRF